MDTFSPTNHQGLLQRLGGYNKIFFCLLTNVFYSHPFRHLRQNDVKGVRFSKKKEKMEPKIEELCLKKRTKYGKVHVDFGLISEKTAFVFQKFKLRTRRVALGLEIVRHRLESVISNGSTEAARSCWVCSIC